MKKCRIGDLAICIGPRMTGKMFEVVGEVETKSFRLPNGEINQAANPAEDWVLKSLSGPVPTVDGKMVIYGVGHDSCLMPLRPDAVQEAVSQGAAQE